MPDWLIQIAPSIGVGIAVYVGIRVDLALAKQMACQSHVIARKAHGRIDRILERHTK